MFRHFCKGETSLSKWKENDAKRYLTSPLLDSYQAWRRYIIYKLNTHLASQDLVSLMSCHLHVLIALNDKHLTSQFMHITPFSYKIE